MGAGQFAGGGFGSEGFAGVASPGGGAGGGQLVGGLRERSQGANDPGAQDRAQLIVQRQKRSYYWQVDNFYAQWEQVMRSYKCEREPWKKTDRYGHSRMDPGSPDGTIGIGSSAEEDMARTAVGMPDTWAQVRRTVARITAQPPNLRFNAKDPQVAELIGRTLMFQWDKAKVQKIQKRHATQAALFGWSVRPWRWASNEYTRTRRVNPLKPDLDDVTIQQIIDEYGIDPQTIQDPAQRQMVFAQLLAQHSRAGMLPITYDYKGYEGPMTEFLFLGDCFPEPNFTTLQQSNWFIVERRWNLTKIEKWVQRYPEFGPGFQNLIDKYPNGTAWNYITNETAGLRQRLIAAIDRIDTSNMSQTDIKTKEWTIQEQWVPGPNSTLTLVGEKSEFLGEIASPYSIDGLIPFTEMVLIPDILSGIGDSTARIMRGLQLVHDRQTNARLDLVYNLARPLMGTSDAELFENADSALARLEGFRLVKMRSQGDLWGVNEQSAMAATAVSLQDDTAIARMIQMMTGETNMSLAANVDPGQARTATGARIMAYNSDILTKDLVDAFTETSLTADAEMMYLLNRSEQADPIEFHASRYRREYTEGEDIIRDEWVKVEPELFQIDGEIVAEAGSTLADDDEAKVTKATNLFHAATAFPQYFNVQKATQEFLTAMGKGKELQAWSPPPPPPPPPPDVRTSITVSAKWESLTEEEKQAFLNGGKIQIQLVPPTDPQLQPAQPPGGDEGMPPGGPPPPGQPPGPAPGAGGPAPPGQTNGAPPPLIAASALAAARGRSPLGGEHGLPS